MSHTLGKRERELRDQGQTPCLAMEGRNGETCDILGISDISHMLQSRLDFALDSEVGAVLTLGSPKGETRHPFLDHLQV